MRGGGLPGARACEVHEEVTAMSTAGSLRRLRNGSTAVLHRSLARAVHVRQSYVERARHTRSRRRERHWLEFVEEHHTR